MQRYRSVVAAGIAILHRTTWPRRRLRNPVKETNERWKTVPPSCPVNSPMMRWSYPALRERMDESGVGTRALASAGGHERRRTFDVVRGRHRCTDEDAQSYARALASNDELFAPPGLKPDAVVPCHRRQHAPRAAEGRGLQLGRPRLPTLGSGTTRETRRGPTAGVRPYGGRRAHSPRPSLDLDRRRRQVARAPSRLSSDGSASVGRRPRLLTRHVRGKTEVLAGTDSPSRSVFGSPSDEKLPDR